MDYNCKFWTKWEIGVKKKEAFLKYSLFAFASPLYAKFRLFLICKMQLYFRCKSFTKLHIFAFYIPNLVKCNTQMFAITNHFRRSYSNIFMATV